MKYGHTLEIVRQLEAKGLQVQELTVHVYPDHHSFIIGTNVKATTYVARDNVDHRMITFFGRLDDVFGEKIYVICKMAMTISNALRIAECT